MRCKCNYLNNTFLTDTRNCKTDKCTFDSKFSAPLPLLLYSLYLTTVHAHLPTLCSFIFTGNSEDTKLGNFRLFYFGQLKYIKI